MATDKTRSVSARVPVDVADALEADAAEIGTKPGALLRSILTRRYRVAGHVRNSDGRARKIDDDSAPIGALRD